MHKFKYVLKNFEEPYPNSKWTSNRQACDIQHILLTSRANIERLYHRLYEENLKMKKKYNKQIKDIELLKVKIRRLDAKKKNFDRVSGDACEYTQELRDEQSFRIFVLEESNKFLKKKIKKLKEKVLPIYDEDDTPLKLNDEVQKLNTKFDNLEKDLMEIKNIMIENDENENENKNRNESANVNENANANVNENENANKNDNGNVNENVEENDNANVNVNENGNVNEIANGNENGNVNANANDSANVNENANANVNENDNANANENENTNAKGNGTGNEN